MIVIEADLIIHNLFSDIFTLYCGTEFGLVRISIPYSPCFGTEFAEEFVTE